MTNLTIRKLIPYSFFQRSLFSLTMLISLQSTESLARPEANWQTRIPIQLEERHDLGFSENGQIRQEEAPRPTIASHGVNNDPFGFYQTSLDSVISEIRDQISTVRLEYETCDEHNNYIENSLTKDPLAIKKNFDESFSPICTYAALQANVKGHRQCINGISHYKKTPPCLSEQYHKSIHNSLILVAQCTGMDVKVLFDLFNTESSLHMNVRSKRYATGPAQLTGGFIRDINLRVMEQVFDENNKACLEIKLYVPKKMPDKYTCDRLAPPPVSPLQNMLYGAMGFRDMREQLMRIYLRHNPEVSVPRHLSLFEAYQQLDPGSQRILTETAMYSYNHGSSLINNYFEKFMRRYKQTNYDHFTSSQGEWLQFLIQETKDKNDDDKEFINYVYPTSSQFPGYNGSTSQQAESLNQYLEEFDLSPNECSHYYTRNH